MPETQPKNATFRNAVLTIYTFLEFDSTDFEKIKDKIRYFAYGRETCPKTGRPHLQAFAQSWKPMRPSGWSNLFPRIHIEPMRGRFRENDAYCSKESRLQEFGEKPNENGVKTTLISYKRKIDQGEKTEEVAESEDYFPTYIQYRNGLRAYEHHMTGKRMKGNHDLPEVYIRYGAAGTGKSRHVYDSYPDVYTMPDNTAKWFGSYNGQPTVLFDDVEINDIPTIGWFKRITDRYPIEVPIKGGFTWWKPKRIYFTSNSHWTVWWKNLSEQDQAAIKRRLTSIKYLSEDGNEVEEWPERENSQDGWLEQQKDVE